MQITYDVGRERLQELAPVLDDHALGRNEATTRLQLIDRLLFDCLGWEREEAELEDHAEGKFADYVLDRRARRLVVEAKREGTWFELPTGTGRTPKIAALLAIGGDVESAIRQAATYSQRRGIPYAAVCNGHQLIAFVGSRQDGVSFEDGRGLVFESPADMVEGFSDLWDLLGARGTGTRRLTRRLSAAAAAPPPKLSEQIAGYPGSAPAEDDQYLFSSLRVLFLPDYVRDDQDEIEFLDRCYSPPGAYSQLAALNRGLLRARYSAALGQEIGVALEEARTKEGLNPALVDEVASTSAGRQALILLGDVGVGKTMFLRRLLRVDAKELADDAVTLYVDLGRSAVIGDMGTYVYASFESQLFERYGVDIGEDAFLRGTYHTELRQFARGVNAPLIELDAAEFKCREIDHLRGLSANLEEHLRRSLEHLVKLRRKQVVVVLDNTDQRKREHQEEVFLIAEAVATRWPCTVFVTLRPETFNASRIRGTLSGYQPRAFTVDPPRVERVVIKRLAFGQEHLDAEGRLPSWLGWTTASEDVELYLDVLLKSFTRSTYLQDALINLSGGNARRALELVTEFVDSPHAEPRAILERNSSSRHDYLVPHHLFLRAVLLGTSAYYDPGRSRFPNLFDTSTKDAREHFLMPCLLGLLRRAAEQKDGEGYMPLEDTYKAFQDLGFALEQIDFALRRSRDADLVAVLPPEGDPRSIRLTTIGAYLHQQLAREFSYFDVTCVDLPVVDPACREKLTVVRSIRQRLERCDVVLGYLDECWTVADLEEAGLFDWAGAATAVRHEMNGIRGRL